MLIATGASEYFTQDVEDMGFSGKEEDGPPETAAKAEPVKTEPVKTEVKKEEPKKEETKPVGGGPVKQEQPTLEKAKPAAQPEEKKEAAPATAEPAKKEEPAIVVDPRQSILGQGDETFDEKELSILAVHKAKADAYTNYELLRKNAEELVFNCMMDGLTTEKAQPLRTYINQYYHFLKVEAAAKLDGKTSDDK